MGYFVSLAFGYAFGASVFIATALTAASIAITANVLKEMGRLTADAARAIIGAAVIDDVLGLLVLAVTNGLVKGASRPLGLARVCQGGPFLASGRSRGISASAGFLR